MRIPVLCLWITLGLILPAGSFAEDTSDSGMLSHTQAVEDTRYLIDAIETAHPDPYSAFGGKIRFKQAVLRLIDNIPADGLSAVDLHERLQRFTCRLADLHTHLGAPPRNQDRPPDRYLPLRFKVAADGLFVNEVKEGWEQLMGKQLLAVNKCPIDSLSRFLSRMVSAENHYGLLAQLSWRIRYSTYLNELAPAEDSSTRLRLMAPGGDIQVVAVPMLDHETYQAIDWLESEHNTEVRSDGLLAAQILNADAKVGYLWLAKLTTREAYQIARANQSSYLEPSLIRLYKQTLHRKMPEDINEAIAGVPSLVETLQELLSQMKTAGSSHLIVDLRRNGGGWTESIHPMMYLLYGDRYFQQDFPVQWSYNVSRFYLAKFNLTIDTFNENQGTNLDVGDYYFQPGDSLDDSRLRRERYLDELAADSLPFHPALAALDGDPVYMPRVVVVVSPSTGSAAYHLMYYLWRMGATIVGVPPAQAGNAFMDLTPITLPNSGLEAFVAHSAVTMFPDDPVRGKTFRPDVTMTCSDFAAENWADDAEIARVVDLIEQGQL